MCSCGLRVNPRWKGCGGEGRGAAGGDGWMARRVVFFPLSARDSPSGMDGRFAGGWVGVGVRGQRGLLVKDHNLSCHTGRDSEAAPNHANFTPAQLRAQPH